MKQLRIGITGASGFIGQELIRQLSAQGHHLVVLSRSAKKFSKQPFLTIVEADLSRPKKKDIQKFTKDLDLLYHLAAELKDSRLMLATNVEGTQTIVNNTAQKTTLIYLSSMGIFSSNKGETIDEKSPVNPQNAYERSKLATEEIILNKRELKAVILRPSIVLGPSMKSGLIKQLLRLSQSNVRLKISPDVVANFVHASDVVNALLVLGNSNKAIGQQYNFSNDIALAEFIKELAAVLKIKTGIGLSAKLFQQLLKLLKFIGLLNISKDGIAFFSNTSKMPANKIKEELGFKFKGDYRSFIEEYVNCTK